MNLPNKHFRSSFPILISQGKVVTLLFPKMKIAILLAFVVAIGVANGTFLGLQRKRFSGKQPSNAKPKPSGARTSMPLVSPFPEAKDPCCKPIYGDPITRVPVADPDFVPPERPLLKMADYQVRDVAHSQDLHLFDPEAWVSMYPGRPFPSDLDIPYAWSIYNPVTVQAPQPDFPLDVLQRSRFTGFYYACPNLISPYEYAWYFRNSAISPCKWTLYQTHDHAVPVAPAILVPYNGVPPPGAPSKLMLVTF